MGLTFDRLQAEVGEWATRNFPTSTDNESFHGVVEEVGELAGSIYGFDVADHSPDGVAASKAKAEIADAIGDTIVFLCDYAQRRGLAISSALGSPHGYAVETLRDLQDEASMRADDGDPFYSLAIAVGQLAHARLKARQGIRNGSVKLREAEWAAVGRIAICLALVSSCEGIDFEAAVAGTWAAVKCRDWIANPATGRAAEPVTIPNEPDVYPDHARTILPCEA